MDAAGPACRVTSPVLLTSAIGDMETAYTDAAGWVLPDVTELGAGNIDGMALIPGLYKWGAPVLIPTGLYKATRARHALPISDHYLIVNE